MTSHEMQGKKKHERGSLRVRTVKKEACKKDKSCRIKIEKPIKTRKF